MLGGCMHHRYVASGMTGLLTCHMGHVGLPPTGWLQML